MFEMRRNEKKAVRYKDLNTWPIHIVSQTVMISLSKGMSMIFLMVAVNGLCKTKDF